MHISAKADYGLRAVLELSLSEGQGIVQSADIAVRQNIPESYLVQLLNMLRRAGVVRSVRGPRGGHELLRRPEDLTVGEVLTILDGPVDLTGEDRSGKAAGVDVLREVWRDVEVAIEAVLSGVTFADLCRRHRIKTGNYTFRI
jgi:Rrf2 family protein